MTHLTDSDWREVNGVVNTVMHGGLWVIAACCVVYWVLRIARLAGLL
jgi:hypothetical protein